MHSEDNGLVAPINKSQALRVAQLLVSSLV
jgi:hypothetical protein